MQRKKPCDSSFKEDLHLKYLETNPKYYFERLEALISDMYIANEQLNEFLKIKKQNIKLFGKKYSIYVTNGSANTKTRIEPIGSIRVFLLDKKRLPHITVAVQF